MSTSTTTSTRERALKLLGQNVDPTTVAAALGVTPAVISQLLSDSEFSRAVSELRFTSLTVETSRDERAGQIEDKLLEKLSNAVEFLVDPMKLALIYSKVNGAKRRGATAPESIHQNQTVVPLTLPNVIFNQFTQHNTVVVNGQNQVVKVGDKDLVTIQSGRMDKLLEQAKALTSENSNVYEPTESALALPVSTGGRQEVNGTK